MNNTGHNTIGPSNPSFWDAEAEARKRKEARLTAQRRKVDQIVIRLMIAMIVLGAIWFLTRNQERQPLDSPVPVTPNALVASWLLNDK